RALPAAAGPEPVHGVLNEHLDLVPKGCQIDAPAEGLVYEDPDAQGGRGDEGLAPEVVDAECCCQHERHDDCSLPHVGPPFQRPTINIMASISYDDINVNISKHVLIL